MRILLLTVTLILCLLAAPALAADKTIGVFVALCDNKSQGIVPVPAAIGNGDDPENNLYWGNSEGLKGTFDHSRKWKLIAKNDTPQGDILRTRTYRHAQPGAVLTARAYRGRSIRKCLADYESAVLLGSYDLVVYIGHNGLMDFALPQSVKSRQQARHPDCAVLCCKSEAYFKARLANAGGRPILLTTQLMYPGAFILSAISESWLEGSKVSAIRESAGASYAKNQKISRKAGIGVFADLKN